MKYLKAFENKYIDDILDRKKKYGKLSDSDKEYIDKFSKGEDTSKLEKDMDLFDEIKKYIFDRKPNPDWDFIISAGWNEKLPIFYDKNTKEIKQRGSVIFDIPDFNIYLVNPSEAEKANKSMQDELQDFLWKIIMETDTYINGKYVGYNKNQIIRNLNKMNVSFDKVIKDDSIDIRIWDFESIIKLKIIFSK